MMTTTLETMTANLTQLETYRDGLKDEARRTVDARSRNDRLTEITRVNNQISRLLDRMEAVERDEENVAIILAGGRLPIYRAMDATYNRLDETYLAGQ